MMADAKLVMLAVEGESTNIIYHALAEEFNVVKIIIEEPVSKLEFVRRRRRKLGLRIVAGQILFRALVVPYLVARSRERRGKLKAELHLNDAPIDSAKIVNVPSVNSDETVRVLQELKPDVVVVNGTRIISTRVLDCVTARFINMHTGITPLYRGVHGGYWALVEGDRDACGVTVHIVDAGIDTGGVLGQNRIEPTPDDNFVTYPLLQVAAGLSLLKQATRDAIAGQLKFQSPPAGNSKLWSHPTMGEYVRHRVRRGVS